MAASRVWSIRSMEGGATGLEFAHANLGAEHDVVLAHALPVSVRIEIHEGGSLVASADDLHDASASTPISKLTVDGVRVLRENMWPQDGDAGSPVILPGGEVGILRSWWNDDEGARWRWTIELEGSSR